MATTKEILAQLRKDKKKIQQAKSPIGYYSPYQAFELLKINDAIREYKRVS